MPELSNSFRAGKMNKDLDERLVSNGEYRDALNIEVTTSEGSNVGTAQTILGNRQVTSLLSRRLVNCVDTDSDGTLDSPVFMEPINHTVGHIVDEKVDRIIRFVSSPPSENGGVGIDRIMEYNTDIRVNATEIPIFVDVYNVQCNVSAGTSTSFTVNTNSQYLREGMKFKLEDASGNATAFTYALDLIIDTITYTIDASCDCDFCYTAEITWKYSNGESYTPSTNPASGYTAYFKSPRVLNFDNADAGSNGIARPNSITGINIVDDMLFWTDDYSEPKKIHIPRSKEGTVDYVMGPYTSTCSGAGTVVVKAHERHTALVVKDINSPTKTDLISGTYILKPNQSTTLNALAITEEHITVIRKGPTMPPTIETFKTSDVDNDVAGSELPAVVNTQTQILLATNINNANVPWSTTPPNPTSSFVFDEYPGYQAGAPITSFNPQDLLKFTISYTNSVGLYQTAEMVCTVNTAGPGTGANTSVSLQAGQYEVSINSMSSNHPVNPPSPTKANYFLYDVEVIEKKPMWEMKFPRFAYRYKYSDGEYSVFSPFSDVAFVPEPFDYLPKKGYNIGMQNNLRYLEISDWVPKDIPKDVVQVDLIYKESSSPNTYTVESFKPNDLPAPGQSVNYWNQKGTKSSAFNTNIDRSAHAHSGAFIVTSDLIHATIPANQLLRPWDNVPRKAIAQEVTGNRIVYANYLQNYDLYDSGGNTIPKPEFELSIDSVNHNHQLFTKHGIPGRSLKSMRNYQLGVVYRDNYGRETPVLTSQSGTIKIPKNNAGSYNKIAAKITTPAPAWAKSFKFFIKETSNEYYNLAMDRYYPAKDGNVWLSFPSAERNKVSEDTFLILKKEHNNHNAVTEKARYKVIAIENNAPDFIKTENQPWGAITPTPSFVDSGTPYTGKQNIEIDLDQWNNSAFGGLVTQNVGGIQIKVRTSRGDYESLWYDVTNVGTVNYGTKSVKRLTVKNVFGEDMEFTSEDGGVTMEPNLVLEVRQKKVVNKAQFDGRFFVKIQSDSTLEKRLQSAWGNEDAELIPLISKKISLMNYCSPGGKNMRHFNDWDKFGDDGGQGGNSTSSINGSGVGNGNFQWCSQHGWPGDTNYAAGYSVPLKGGTFVYTGIQGSQNPRTINAGANGSQAMYQDKYFPAEMQPMVLPHGSRWNTYTCNNSPGPSGGDWYELGHPSCGSSTASCPKHKNSPPHMPADQTNGPWKGEGSSYPGRTPRGSTSWGSNYSGIWSIWTRNPVGGMLYEYCDDISGATCGGASFGEQIGFLGLGTFADNRGATTDVFDPHGVATFPTGYNGGNTYIVDSAGNPAGMDTLDSYFNDEILGATGYYGRAWLRSQWVHASNPTEIGDYPTPYRRPTPTTSGTQPQSFLQGEHAYPPQDEVNKWVDWYCTQNKHCNPNYGCDGDMTCCGCTQGTEVSGYWDQPANEQHWVFGNETAKQYKQRPEPNVELPRVYRENQFPLNFPRKSIAHPPVDWWHDWWTASGVFNSLTRPSDVIMSNPDGTQNYSTFGKSKRYGTTPTPKDDPGKRWFIDHVGAAQDKCGGGIFNDSTTGIGNMQISFIGVGTGGIDNTVWNMSETPTEMGFADAISTPGTRFRFKEDHNQTVYTITSSMISTDGDPGSVNPEDGKPVYSPTPWNENPEILNFENDSEKPEYWQKLNRRIRWKLTLDKPIGEAGSPGDVHPYYHPLTNAVDPRLIDTYGDHETNPMYNPYGLTTGHPGEAYGKAAVNVDGAVVGKVITLDEYMQKGTCSTGSTHTETACDSAGGTWTAWANEDRWQATHNLAIGQSLLGDLGTASDAKYNGVNIVPVNDYEITIEDIDDDGDQTVIYLNKSITVANNATLSFRNDPAHVKSFEVQGSSNYTSTNFNNTSRNYECSNWASQTCNMHWARNYMYTFSITTVAGSDLVTHSSSTSTSPAQNQKILDGDTVSHANVHRNSYIVERPSTTTFRMNRPALASGNVTATFYRPGFTGLNEWGLNYQTIEILTSFDDTGSESDLPMSPNPAIWETEPREDLGMDIYYETGQAYPVKLEVGTGEEYIKVGDSVTGAGIAPDTYVESVHGNMITLSQQTTSALSSGQDISFKESVFRGDGSIESRNTKEAQCDGSASGVYTIKLKPNVHDQKRTLKYFNCFSFMNGVESNRLRDDYNAVTIDKGVKASMPMATPYEAERRKSGLIFSGIYNSTSGVNETNQFIQAEPITKDLNPVHGAIQKIFARDTDLVTFCEDKVFKILANKDAVFSAGGNANITATNKVLGQTIPFSGDYGMSDRTSFAEESFRMYFVDKNRGAVLRLSRDGMTPISNYGMKDYFFDNLKGYQKIIGSFNDRKEIYNLTLDDSWTEDPKTISYTEDTRGWVSFKSFIPEGGCGFNNNYYTFSNGEIWRHHYEKCVTVNARMDINNSHGNGVTVPSLPIELYSNTDRFDSNTMNYGVGGLFWAVSGEGINSGTYVTGVEVTYDGCAEAYSILFNQEVFLKSDSTLTLCAPRNNFYQVQYDSAINVLLNQGPDTIKAFSTMKYEGSQAMVKAKERDRFSGGYTTGNSTQTYYIDCNHNAETWQSNEGGAGFWGDGNYYNNVEKPGWYISRIETDQQKGKVKDFKNKEGKWFNYIIGNKRNEDLSQEKLDTREFSLQGLDLHECVTAFEVKEYDLRIALKLPHNTINSTYWSDIDTWVKNNIDELYWTDLNSTLGWRGLGGNTTVQLESNPTVDYHLSQHEENEILNDYDVLPWVTFLIQPNQGFYIHALSYGVAGGQVLNTDPQGQWVEWEGAGSGSPFKNFTNLTPYASYALDNMILEKTFKIKFENTTSGWEADNKVRVTVFLKSVPLTNKQPELEYLEPIIIGDATNLNKTTSWDGIA